MLALNMQDNDMTRRVRGQILHALFNYKKVKKYFKFFMLIRYC